MKVAYSPLLLWWSCCAQVVVVVDATWSSAASASASASFIFGGEPMIRRHPQLTEFMQVQQDLRVGLQLDIGGGGMNSKNKKMAAATTTTTTTRLVIPKFILNLHANNNHKEQTAASSTHTIKMPGMNGEHPHLSGGLQAVTVIQPGQLITMGRSMTSSQGGGGGGIQYVTPTQACWELVWKKDAHAGSLLLGLEFDQDYHRNADANDDDANANAAVLPKGTLYLNFPVWSQEGLAIAIAAQTKAIRRAQECLVERDYELLQMQATNNPWMKVWHYRNAYAAAETHALQPLQHYQDIVPSGPGPSTASSSSSSTNNDNGRINLPGDLVLTTKGSCWTKQLPRGPQTLLGTAKLSNKLG